VISSVHAYLAARANAEDSADTGERSNMSTGTETGAGTGTVTDAGRVVGT
jgi:hypothetical protein